MTERATKSRTHGIESLLVVVVILTALVVLLGCLLLAVLFSYNIYAADSAGADSAVADSPLSDSTLACLTAPEATDVLEGETRELVIRIDEEGAYHFAGEQVDLEELEKILQRVDADSTSRTRVVIEADDDVKLQHAADLVNACIEAGLRDCRLAPRSDDGDRSEETDRIDVARHEQRISESPNGTEPRKDGSTNEVVPVDYIEIDPAPADEIVHPE